MGGLSVGILWSDFAMLQNGSGVSQILVLSVIGDVESGTSQFIAAELAFAQALEQKLCNTPEVGSSHLGCRWQFYEREENGVRKQDQRAPTVSHTSHTLFWFVFVALLLVVGFCGPGPAARVAAIAEDCEFPRFGRFGKIEGGNRGKVF